MTYTEALQGVRALLSKHAPDGLEVNIYDYQGGETGSRPLAGCIVAEVSFSNDRGGFSFMQSDLPHGLAVCAQTERCILARAEDWDADETAEEDARLDFLMTGESNQ